MSDIDKIDKKQLGISIAKKYTEYIHGDTNEKYSINRDNHCLPNMHIGMFCTIRSVNKKRDGKDLHIGIYLGSIYVLSPTMPVIYVPKLDRIIAGFESWWKPIPKENYSLSCEEMKAKYDFSWKDIEKEVEFLVDLMNISKEEI